jgi:hypothetical protein
MVITLTFWAGTAHAYRTYSDPITKLGNCWTCHGTNSIGTSRHNMHVADMLNNDCSTCHSEPGVFFPVTLDLSFGGAGLQPIACMGCHGREDDMGNDSVSLGRGAGLRQHHWNTGTTFCVGCHSDSNPAAYTPAGENVAPDYYLTPDGAHPLKPTNACNPSGEENRDGDPAGLGLDNDGDNFYDTNDLNCQVIEPVCGNEIIDWAGTAAVRIASSKRRGAPARTGISATATKPATAQDHAWRVLRWTAATGSTVPWTPATRRPTPV